MMRSWKIGTAFGIGVYVHWSFLLLPALVLLQNWDSGLTAAAFFVGLLLAVFACVVLHEFGHALAARGFGIRTRDITLYPIGGVARLERMSEKPSEEVLIALAGPAVNVVLVGLLLLGWFAGAVVAPGLFVPHGMDLSPGVFLLFLIIANVFLAGFNLLPAFPTDGGRVFRALLSMKLGHLRATRIAAGVGAVMALLMGVVGLVVFHSPVLPVVALFLFVAGQQELRAAEWQHQQRWAEPIPEVLPAQPVFRGPAPVFPDLRPTVKVYTWDEKAGVWIPEKRILPDPLG
jgi:Zn-dependent protease